MEIESKNGPIIKLQDPSATIDFGRGLGFESTDLTVSRRHISFQLHEDPTRVYFEVQGRNPVWVHDTGSNEIRVCGKSETGEMRSGDSFCVFSKNPVWFNLKQISSEYEDMNQLTNKLNYDDEAPEISGIEHVEIETGDISHIDPVKEFNFVVMGHEFEKNMIRDIKNWDWFLEEPKEDSDDDETSDNKRKKGIRKRRKRGGRGEEDDDVWTGESEEDAEMIKKPRKVPRPKYSTRSKDREKTKKGTSASKSAMNTRKTCAKNEEEDEDDEYTLGGFIVKDEDLGEENDDDNDDDEEEEFEEDEDDEE